MAQARTSALRGILIQLCPRCRMGKILRGSPFWWAPIHARCPVCDLRFEREPGYFLGAMYIGYGLALLTIAVFTGLVWAISTWSLRTSVLVAVLAFLPFTPLLTQMARVLWIYFDQTIDPDRT